MLAFQNPHTNVHSGTHLKSLVLLLPADNCNFTTHPYFVGAHYEAGTVFMITKPMPGDM